MSCQPLQQKLINSGHYQRLKNGKVRSTHFKELIPHPIYPALHSTPFLAGGIENIKSGSHYVYESWVRFDAAGDNVRYKGLQDCVRIEVPNRPPIYVVDNHHKVFFAWHEALALGYINKGATLATTDKHADKEPPQVWSQAEALSQVASYVRENLWIANFLLPAIAKGLFSQAWLFFSKPNEPSTLYKPGGICGRTTTVRDFYHLNNIFEGQVPEPDIRGSGKGSLLELSEYQTEPQNFVFDLDLDALVAQEYPNSLPTPQDFAQAVKFLARIAKKAGVVTIATSPAFAHHSTTIALAKQLVAEIIK
ncbi:MAG: UPF0489 family protein [bacterium]